jgi:muconolactone D-isomerase
MSDTVSDEGRVASSAGSLSEFLVQMETLPPADFPPDERAELLRAEAARARELASAGMLARLWRVAGRRANVVIWRATTTAALHEALESLPLFPYLDIQVVPLSRHPNDPALAAGRSAPMP